MVKVLARSQARFVPDDLKTSLAAKIRAGRQRLGLTQEELASRIGRTPESISNIERAQQLPALDTLADLSRALRIPISEFFEDRDNGGKVSLDRTRLEAKFREIGRALSDHDLKIAVLQASVFLTVGEPSDS